MEGHGFQWCPATLVVVEHGGRTTFYDGHGTPQKGLESWGRFPTGMAVLLAKDRQVRWFPPEKPKLLGLKEIRNGF